MSNDETIHIPYNMCLCTQRTSMSNYKTFVYTFICVCGLFMNRIREDILNQNKWAIMRQAGNTCSSSKGTKRRVSDNARSSSKHIWPTMMSVLQ